MRRGRNFRFTRLLIIILVICGVVWGVKKIYRGSSGIISPLAIDDNSITIGGYSLFGKSKPKDLDTLVAEIKIYIDKQPGFYSVYIKELDKDNGKGINETTVLTAASINKIPIIATLYFDAQKGDIDLDERITIQESDIQDYGTGTIRYQGAGSVYSLKTLAQLLMEKSDNTASYVLTNRLGSQHIQDLINSWGLTQTDIKNNKTSNYDMALLMSKIYKGQIANQSLTTEMLGFMDDTDFEDRIPALLPKDVPVYHKIGNEVGFLHDVGIVALPKHPYYIGIMTNDITDEEAATKTIANISKMVYDYMYN